MSRPSEIVILAEDTRHQRFVRRILRLIGTRNPPRLRPVPSGSGAGEQWVRAQYPIEVAEFRRRQVSVVLIAVIDADTHTVIERARQLQPPRTSDEPIIHLIPKRNIETWIKCLNGGVVNEIEDYKNERGLDEKIRPAAEAFLGWFRNPDTLPQNCIPSLRTGLEEWSRFRV